MKFNIPTSTKFNSWSLSEKACYIDYETAGHIMADVGGFLIYQKEDCFIEYRRDGNANLSTATATDLKAGMQKLIMFILANEIMKNKN